MFPPVPVAQVRRFQSALAKPDERQEALPMLAGKTDFSLTPCNKNAADEQGTARESGKEVVQHGGPRNNGQGMRPLRAGACEQEALSAVFQNL